MPVEARGEMEFASMEASRVVSDLAAALNQLAQTNRRYIRTANARLNRKRGAFGCTISYDI